MKKTLLLCACFGLLKVSLGQDVGLKLISSCGEQFDNSKYQISWSLGESVISSFEVGASVLTQGFHQSTNDITTSIEPPLIREVEIKAYPNPTIDYLTLESNQVDLTGMKYQIIDMRGIVLESAAVCCNKERLNFSAFPEGVYFIIINQKKQVIKKIKIIKN